MRLHSAQAGVLVGVDEEPRGRDRDASWAALGRGKTTPRRSTPPPSPRRGTGSRYVGGGGGALEGGRRDRQGAGSKEKRKGQTEPQTIGPLRAGR